MLDIKAQNPYQINYLGIDSLADTSLSQILEQVWHIS
jgi:hypothetical protein